MHNDHNLFRDDIIVSPMGYTTLRERNGNRVLDPATLDLLLAWCEAHRPDLCWALNGALWMSRTYWGLRMGRIDGNRDEMRAAARLVRQLSASAVTAFQAWSLSN